MILIYGSKKDSMTRKTQRFFQERRIAFQFRDQDQDPPKAGELENLAQALGGWEQLLDRDSKDWKDLGLAWQEFDPRQTLCDHPRLMVQPIVRQGKKAWFVQDEAILKSLKDLV